MPTIIPIRVEVPGKVNAGAGMLSRATSTETVIYTNQRASFRGAWYCTGGVMGSGDSTYLQVQVDRGFINGLEPMVGKIPLGGRPGVDGKRGDPAPFVKGKSDWDEEGRVWVGIRIQIDTATGNLKNTSNNLTEKDLTVMMYNKPFIASTDGSVYFHPIAVIRKDMPIIQIAYFNYQWATFKQRGFWRHSLIPS